MIILDTSFLVAFHNSRDVHHASARPVMDDLVAAGTDLLTIGQYLRPTAEHYPVAEYVPLEAYERYRQYGLARGFHDVMAGPLVRSSYHADQGLSCVPGVERGE